MIHFIDKGATTTVSSTGLHEEASIDLPIDLASLRTEITALAKSGDTETAIPAPKQFNLVKQLSGLKIEYDGHSMEVNWQYLIA